MSVSFDELVRQIALSEHLVSTLKREGAIQTPQVEEAFRVVWRHQFLPQAPLEEAYANRIVVLKEADGVIESSASMPMVIARMLEALDLRPGHRVLEIGSGTGYNAALIAHLVGDHRNVVTVEIDAQIAAQARQNLQNAGYEAVSVIEGDGAAGVHESAPYDRIAITVGLPGLPWALIDQMTPDGRLVLPLWIQGVELVIAFDRVGAALHSTAIYQFSFVRLQGSQSAGEGWAFSKQIDGLRVTRNPHDRVDSLQAAEQLLLRTPSDTHVEMTVEQGTLREGLLIWIALHDSDTRLLIAEGEAANQSCIPCLIGEPGSFHQTVGLLHNGSLALLAADFSDAAPDQPIYVRLYGEDHGLVDRLVAHVNAWDKHAQPLISDLKLIGAKAGTDTLLRCGWQTALPVQPEEIEIRFSP